MGQVSEVDAEGSREDEVNKRQKKKLFNRKCGYRLVKLHTISRRGYSNITLVSEQ